MTDRNFGIDEGESAVRRGLGLWLVRQIAVHHGGEARWLPRDGGGSCFEFTLAASPPVAQR